MSEFVLVSIGMSLLFFMLSLLFFIFKEKSCILIAGYNSKPKAERLNYDEVRLSKDYG